jgi:hypothetical protein
LCLKRSRSKTDASTLQKNSRIDCSWRAPSDYIRVRSLYGGNKLRARLRFFRQKCSLEVQNHDFRTHCIPLLAILIPSCTATASSTHGNLKKFTSPQLLSPNRRAFAWPTPKDCLQILRLRFKHFSMNWTGSSAKDWRKVRLRWALYNDCAFSAICSVAF